MIIVKTPLRISFVGGGSDMKNFYSRKNGKVVCSAVDKFVYAIVKERFDDKIYINYSRKECIDHVEKPESGPDAFAPHHMQKPPHCASECEW